MIGLMIIGAFLLYLLVSLGVVLAARNWARRTGRSPTRWGWTAAIGMYLLVFWDWIPTVLAHKYYCATQAGFFVYKTLEQWKQENPGVAHTLSKYGDGRSYDVTPTEIVFPLNQRISWHHKVSKVFLEVGRYEDVLYDDMTGERLATKVDFESGRCSGAPKSLKDFRFWIVNCGCAQEKFRTTQGLAFITLKQQYQNAGETK